MKFLLNGEILNYVVLIQVTCVGFFNLSPSVVVLLVRDNQCPGNVLLEFDG